MVYDKARELAKEIADSEEHAAYKQAKEKAMANATTAALIKQYHQLQMQAQAAVMAGKKDEEQLNQLQKLGELLQLNADASAYLIAEYRLNIMVGDVYKILAEAIEADLSALED
ncbi:MAG: YlbF family regulator [Christensenellaceae bacterium]|jgi:cell fate (sporulation/competence/biofilm development) regulator YlbF (YheA/YmcA/DUF963 family)|nr:YlbF family regulator [Christensenellaceae bacterium]